VYCEETFVTHKVELGFICRCFVFLLSLRLALGKLQTPSISRRNNGLMLVQAFL
jgi:hypothetical protein